MKDEHELIIFVMNDIYYICQTRGGSVDVVYSFIQEKHETVTWWGENKR